MDVDIFAWGAGILYFNKYPQKASNTRRNGVPTQAASFTMRDRARNAPQVLGRPSGRTTRGADPLPVGVYGVC